MVLTEFPDRFPVRWPDEDAEVLFEAGRLTIEMEPADPFLERARVEDLQGPSKWLRFHFYRIPIFAFQKCRFALER
jgi:hypothetical protein